MVMVTAQMGTLMAIIITAAAAAVAAVGNRHHHHHRHLHHHQKSSDKTKGRNRLWRSLGLSHNRVQFSANVAELGQPKPKSKSKSGTAPTAERSTPASSTAATFVLAAAVAFANLQYSLLGVLSINPSLVAAKAAVVVEEVSATSFYRLLIRW